MTKPLIFTVSILGLLLLVSSCDRPACKNTNPIFDNYAADTKEYKDELVEQLTKIDKSKLTYWMDFYQENNNREYIHAHMQSDELCATIILTVNESNKGIEGLLQSKGGGYSGAQLKGLKYKIQQDSTATDFIFQEVSAIAD